MLLAGWGLACQIAYILIFLMWSMKNYYEKFMKSKLWIYEFIMKNMKNKIKSLPRKSRAVIALCEYPNALMWNSTLQAGTENCTSKLPSKYTLEYFF